jgi:three-Cys-motif partner protein
MATVEGDHHARYYNLECNDAVVPIGRALDQLGPSLLSFAFIDPTNWQMRFDSVARLTEGRRMDLLIVFHSGQMKRCVDVPPPALALFFGDSPGDPEWLRKYQDARRLGKSGTAALLDHYQNRLRALGYAAFDNRVSVEVANNGVRLYQMLFATENPRGTDFWDKVSNKRSWGQFRFC